jgi:hypothetical protein
MIEDGPPQGAVRKRQDAHLATVLMRHASGRLGHGAGCCAAKAGAGKVIERPLAQHLFIAAGRA